MVNAAAEVGGLEIRPAPSPLQAMEKIPFIGRAAETTARARRAISDVIHGHERRRLVAIVGPCSIHDPGEAIAYAEKLRPVARASADALVIVMRTYFEKPRTRGGWKGLLNDPHLDGSFDVERGIELAREVLRGVAERGVPCAAELLDPTAARYLQDGLAWAAIGARTSQSQPHRELASGLEMPVGFKNATNGDLGVAIDALDAARRPQAFLGVDWNGAAAVIRTPGNADGHVVLRGGGGVPNHDPESVAWAAGRARRTADGLVRPVWVDCSHGNSNKDHRRQAAVCRSVLAQVRGGPSAIGGILLESNLASGRQHRQPGAPLQRGVSITDACIGWSETEELLAEAADAVREASPRAR